MSKKGITISKESYDKVVPAFVIWLDQTYPNLCGQLRIDVSDNEAKFSYQSRDGNKLSATDKAMIRRKWESCAYYAKKQQESSIEEYNADSIIQLIKEGKYGAAIHGLINILEEQQIYAKTTEEF